MPGFSGMLINLKHRKMKILYKFLISVTALALLTLTSCLDDEGLGVEVPRYDEVPYVVDFNEVPNSSGFIIRSFKGTTDPTFAQEATFTVNLSSPYTLKKDLDLTVEFDQTATDAFVAANSGWTALPSAKQDFVSATVTIPAGEREATFDVNFYAEGLSADDLLVAAYTISNVSDPDILISGNFGTQYVKVGVSNVYEGEYTVDIDWLYGGGGNYGDSWDDWSLITVSSVASQMDYFYPYWNYPITITVDAGNPQTIDGHDNAYLVTLDAAGKSGTDDVQLDDYNGGVWNYCYQNTEGKWVFKLAHALTTGSGQHIGFAIFTQN